MLNRLKNRIGRGNGRNESKLSEDDAIMQAAIQASLNDFSRPQGDYLPPPYNGGLGPRQPSDGGWVPATAQRHPSLRGSGSVQTSGDEELARKLQAEEEAGATAAWGGGGGGGGRARPSPVSQEGDADAALARRLQEGEALAAQPTPPRRTLPPPPAEEEAEDTSADAELARKLQEEEMAAGFAAAGAGAGAAGAAAAAAGRECGGCGARVNGQFYQAQGRLYHPRCFACAGCGRLIDTPTFRPYEGRLYHPRCALELFHPRCNVCGQGIPADPGSREVKYIRHPFFQDEKACPAHARDGTARCCACQRFERRAGAPGGGGAFADLQDGRKLCLACARTPLVDSAEARPLYEEILLWFETELGLPVPPGMADVPVLLVDEPTLNDRSAGQGGGHGGGGAAGVPTTRGLTLSEQGTVQHMGHPAVLDPFTGRLVPGPLQVFELGTVKSVTAVLVLGGLPYDLCASILAHEAFHAWLRCQNDFPHLPLQVEEGMCQLVAQLWLRRRQEQEEEQGRGGGGGGGGDGDGPSDADLRNLFLFQIETNDSPTYGDGFRMAAAAYAQIGLVPLVDHLKQYQSFPII